MTLWTLLGAAQGAPPCRGPVIGVPAWFSIVLEGWQFWGWGVLCLLGFEEQGKAAVGILVSPWSRTAGCGARAAPRPPLDGSCVRDRPWALL